MTRQYSRYATTVAKRELDRLLAEPGDVESYRAAMTALGGLLGAVVEKQLEPGGRTVVAFSVEDADYLARGFLEAMERGRPASATSVACFWNERVRIGERAAIEQAPIVREYVEPHPGRISALVMVKSIIASACTVKTNLLKLLDATQPRRIFITAPVMYREARASLEAEFPPRIVEKLEYVSFARDAELHGSIVVPGIGGSVYERLGLGTAETKNRTRPQLVTMRRQLTAGSAARW